MSDSAETVSGQPHLVINVGKEKLKASARKRGDKGFYLLGNRVKIKSKLTTAFLSAMLTGLAFEAFGGKAGVWFALTTMIVYLIIGVSIDKTESEKERFADSNYYLGFIFTLFSLFLTLTPWLGNDVNSGNIIEKFGIAVATTFFGMATRVVLIQSLVEPDEEHAEVKQKIFEYLDELQVQIAATLKGMKTFEANIVAATSQATHTLTVEIEQNRKDSVKALDASAKTLTDTVNGVSKQINAAMGALVQRISEVEIKPDMITKRLDEVNNALAEKIGVAIPKFNDIVTAAGELRDSVSSLKKVVDETNTSLAAASRQASESTSKTSSAAENVLQLAQTVGQLAGKMEALSAALDRRAENYGAEFDRAVEEVRKSAAEIRTGKEELNKALVEGANKVRNAVR